MQNGSKEYFGASQRTFKLENGTTQDSVPGNEKRFLVPLKSQAPITVTQHALGTPMSLLQPLHPMLEA